jgi:hypothetical protein
MQLVRIRKPITPTLAMIAVCLAVDSPAGQVAPGQLRADPGISFELEGAITEIRRGSDPQKQPDVISVMRVEVRVPPHLPISTPTATLEFADLLGDPLPGRQQPGFLGGTAIILGMTIGGVSTAHQVFVEPAENVLIGAVTANEGGALSILGVSVRPIDDWRMPTFTRNEYGFDIDPATVEVGSFAVAEGYLAPDGVLHAHTIEADGRMTGPSNQTSITRAQCRGGHELEVRGASTHPNGTIMIYNDVTGELIGSTTVIPDTDRPPFGRYRFRAELGECPTRVRAENSNDSSAVADVENR